MTEYVSYVVSEGFWAPCFVSIRSLLYNNPETAFHIYVVSHEDRNEEFFEKLGHLEDLHNGFSIEFVNIPDEEFKKLPKYGERRLPKGVNIKLLLGECLPNDGKNVLFLDADTVVNGDISRLLNRDMSRCGVAAVPDNKSHLVVGLDLPIEAQYFNSGVMYINTDCWRENSIKTKAFEFIKEWEPQYPEQTALNAVLHRLGLVDILPRTFNASSKTVMGEKQNGESVMSEPPKIIHFYDVLKPWYKAADGMLYQDIWMKHYQKTPFTEFHPQYRYSKRVAIVGEYLERVPVAQCIARCIHSWWRRR